MYVTSIHMKILRSVQGPDFNRLTWQRGRKGLMALLTVLGTSLYAQTDPQVTLLAPSPQTQNAPVRLAPEDLNELLAPIALYPDALVALILPASTVPSDVV